uniref:LRRcap domain-containing protein n=2 Tax=Macrostomum lignano TaxID=282301 RepID=A0A1I8GGT6_9PLAT
MVQITEDLVRRRAEHNECQISTLEELSLHQQDIEKIEHLDKWCRDLKILYLQSNLIGKIENVGRLKKLEYLNLALNNIERVENLEGCESLAKLDLTVNFIGDILSLASLTGLVNLRELYLTGNPCAQFESYRDFVICTLPQLKYLDGEEISRSERIKAEQNYPFIYERTRQAQADWARQREVERQEAAERQREREKLKAAGAGLDEQFMQEKVPYTPESRIETHEFMQEKRRRENPEPEKPAPKQHPLFFPDGRPYNINESKLDFTLTDDEENNAYILDVAVFKHMDTSLIDCDVQPQYIRVTVKGRLLQLALPGEVRTDESSAVRSATTGHLLVTMPKAHGEPLRKSAASAAVAKPAAAVPPTTKTESQPRHAYLEVDESSRRGVVDLRVVPPEADKVSGGKNGGGFAGRSTAKTAVERPNSPGFVDDPDVPPLI